MSSSTSKKKKKKKTVGSPSKKRKGTHARRRCSKRAARRPPVRREGVTAPAMGRNAREDTKEVSNLKQTNARLPALTLREPVVREKKAGPCPGRHGCPPARGGKGTRWGNHPRQKGPVLPRGTNLVVGRENHYHRCRCYHDPPKAGKEENAFQKRGCASKNPETPTRGHRRPRCFQEKAGSRLQEQKMARCKEEARR